MSPKTIVRTLVFDNITTHLKPLTLLFLTLKLLVEEIDLLTTVFLKIDNEKVFYPNATLISKPISNFYRSPDMGDSILFSIAFSTPAAKIATLKETISE